MIALLSALLAAAPATAAPLPFEEEIAAFRAADARAMPPRCASLFVGSSSIRLWPSLAQDFSFPTIQRGFGGSTIADVVDRFDTLVAPYAPRRIIFYAGDNDIDAGHGAARAAADFERFLALKDKALGTTPVYVLSVKPSLARAGQRAEQQALNRRLMALAGRRADLVFVNITQPMLVHGRPDAALLGPDGLHLSAAGYRLWAHTVASAIARRPATRAPGCPA